MIKKRSPHKRGKGFEDDDLPIELVHIRYVVFGATAFPTSDNSIGASIEDGNGPCIACSTMFLRQFNRTFLGSSIGLTLAGVIDNIIPGHEITI